MGLNILVYKVTGVTQAETWTPGRFVPVVDVEDQDSWWDDGRYTGDNDFIDFNEFKFTEYEDGLDLEEKRYYRPSDFNACREWVRKNIFEIGQPRLLNVLDKMEADPSLVFMFSR